MGLKVLCEFFPLNSKGLIIMICIENEAEFLRELFIVSFVDTESDYYQSRIQKKRQFSDGVCYTGYLWDCLKHKKAVSLKYALEFLRMRQSYFYALWDIHSRDLILIHDYWIYPKEAVLLMSADTVPDIINMLPEDCYFFDPSLSWAIALTHEETKPGRRLCFFISHQEDLP